MITKRLASFLAFASWMLALGVSAQTVDLNVYYASAVGQKKEALKAALHEIIKSADVLDYGKGSKDKTWAGFYLTDRILETNQVRDRYCYDKRYFNPESPYAAVSGMNIEHSLANSWWGGSKNQAYKDIHHLMPCETSINSAKGNKSMGKVVNVNTKSSNTCTKVGTGPGEGGDNIDMWEPADEWKGDFARVYFYMVTCYSNLTWKSEGLKSFTNTDWPTLKPWASELYLQWDKDDPIDDIERARNEAVYSIQNNRNPFVDLPGLAEYIWGSKTDVAFTIDGSDIPDPPTPPTPPETEDSVTIINQNFKGAGQGAFRVVQADGTQSQIWAYDNRYGMVGNAFNQGKTGESWLITPAIDLSNMEGATLQFNHATGYNADFNPHTMFDVLVSSDYVQIPDEATWTSLDVVWPSEYLKPTDKFTKFTHSGVVSLDDYAGQVVCVAFRYTATSEQCWAWELSDCVVRAKNLPVGIDQNYMSPIDAEDAVFDMNGRYVGAAVPTKRGIYIVRQGGYTYKRFVK